MIGNEKDSIRKIEEFLFRVFMLVLLLLGGLRVIVPDLFRVIEEISRKPHAQEGARPDAPASLFGAP
jgi:hypothetical protein